MRTLIVSLAQLRRGEGKAWERVQPLWRSGSEIDPLINRLCQEG